MFFLLTSFTRSLSWRLARLLDAKEESEMFSEANGSSTFPKTAGNFGPVLVVDLRGLIAEKNRKRSVLSLIKH